MAAMPRSRGLTPRRHFFITYRSYFNFYTQTRNTPRGYFAIHAPPPFKQRATPPAAPADNRDVVGP
jgi:hypothetical protein